MKLIQIITISAALFGSITFANATSSNVVGCVNQSGDYSDNAYDINNTACHSTDRWQKLGSSWTADSNKESAPSTNDGVTWRVKTAGGVWSDYGTDNEIAAGDEVQFKFDVTRATTGNHQYDNLKAWVDWNQDSVWSEDEDIIDVQWDKNLDSEGNIETAITQADEDDKANGVLEAAWNRDLGDWNSKDTEASFFSGIFTIPDTLSEVLLRARVVCENSLSKYSDGYKMVSYGFQDQGEVEDYRLAVVNKVANPIPEPSTVLVFMLGLIALVANRKRLN